MKKFLGIIVIVFLAVSCSNNDESAFTDEELVDEELADEEPTDDEPADDELTDEELALIGTWTMTAFILEEAHDNNGDGIYSHDFLDELPCLESEYVIRKDRTFEKTSMVVTIDNDPPHVMRCVDIRTRYGSWTINNDEFTRTYDNGITFTFSFDLTDDVLVLSGTSYYHGNFEFYYERQ